jgi:hypothetical protein
LENQRLGAAIEKLKATAEQSQRVWEEDRRSREGPGAEEKSPRSVFENAATSSEEDAPNPAEPLSELEPEWDPAQAAEAPAPRRGDPDELYLALRGESDLHLAQSAAKHESSENTGMEIRIDDPKALNRMVRFARHKRGRFLPRIRTAAIYTLWGSAILVAIAAALFVAGRLYRTFRHPPSFPFGYPLRA